ncbi:hypothetical protein HPP92_028786 [Vanilla planifolia]|uniref:Uncharacterized protein n=1 Tax=Vanilla planifolia TaxID=51239 RepID=A0A835P9P3_VANPL|nr:hypothetical protein HPP92_028786 [Vanilla planifolia]KAG0446575.1 hypothetical protein HPP92_028775 [Vanilla planifolia]
MANETRKQDMLNMFKELLCNEVSPIKEDSLSTGKSIEHFMRGHTPTYMQTAEDYLCFIGYMAQKEAASSPRIKKDECLTLDKFCKVFFCLLKSVSFTCFSCAHVTQAEKVSEENIPQQKYPPIHCP